MARRNAAASLEKSKKHHNRAAGDFQAFKRPTPEIIKKGQEMAKLEESLMKGIIAEKQEEFNQANSNMLNIKTMEIPKIEGRMADELYNDFEKKAELVNLDRDITGRTDELLKLRKQNKKLEARFLPKPGSDVA